MQFAKVVTQVLVRDALIRKVVTREEHPYTFTINLIISFVIGTGMIVGGIVTALS